jgi:hypothetical protein
VVGIIIIMRPLLLLFGADLTVMMMMMAVSAVGAWETKKEGGGGLLLLPDEWDLRTAYPRCRAWGLYNQEALPHGHQHCAQCCPMAIAAALGVRDCITSGRDSRFSAQQLWDCAGTGNANCARGTLLSLMLSSMGRDSGAPYALMPETCAPERGSEPNMSMCIARLYDCSAPFGGGGDAANGSHAPLIGINPNALRLRSAVEFEVLQFQSPPPPPSLLDDNTYDDADISIAMHTMMREILMRGPVVSVLKLQGDNIRRFLEWQGPYFQALPLNGSDARLLAQPLLHCVMVYGWGTLTTAAHGKQPYWLIQNSYGAGWGQGGLARIARGAGLLELSWHALSLTERVCTATPTTACLPSPYGTYTTTTSASPPAAAAASPPSVRPILLSSSRILPAPAAAFPTPRISNVAILVIAFASAAITTLMGMCLFRGPPPRQHHHHQRPAWTTTTSME